MPATSVLDPAQTVLVVIDVQERLAAAMELREKVAAKASLAVRAATITRLPVIVTRQYPKGLGDTDPAILDAIRAHESRGVPLSVVDKVSFDCFGEPGFVDQIESTSRPQILIAGMETHICVTQTALAALRRGHDVHVIADACCSREDASHGYALSRLAHAGAVITTAESAAYELVGTAGTDKFKELLCVVKG